MIRFLFRFTGLWLLAGAFVAFVIDGTRSIAASRIVITPLIDAWGAIHAASAESSLAALDRELPGWLRDAVMAYVLQAPLWVVLGVLGAALVLVVRPRARPIGYSSRD